jgi:hypothetical protein
MFYVMRYSTVIAVNNYSQMRLSVLRHHICMCAYVGLTRRRLAGSFGIMARMCFTKMRDLRRAGGCQTIWTLSSASTQFHLDGLDHVTHIHRRKAGSHYKKRFCVQRFVASAVQEHAHVVVSGWTFYHGDHQEYSSMICKVTPFLMV